MLSAGARESREALGLDLGMEGGGARGAQSKVGRRARCKESAESVTIGMYGLIVDCL